MKTLIVLAHPRRDSLTGTVADIFTSVLEENGHQVEMADLIREDFDPVMFEPDEPDWNRPDKQYSPAVQEEMERVERNDATIMIFPVYWWSVPAILKGWIDRVWNLGWAFGDPYYPQKRAWMIGIAGATEEEFAKRSYHTAMQTQLNLGLLDYCLVEERRLELLYGADVDKSLVDQILIDADRIARSF